MAFDSRGGDGAISQINVTPLVDVMLVLLVIFMVTAPILQQGVAVELPTTKAGPLEGDEMPLVVGVTAAGEIYLNDNVVTAEALRGKLEAIARERPLERVLLRADAAVPYGDVVGVIAAVKQAGINNIGMVTEPPPDAR